MVWLMKCLAPNIRKINAKHNRPSRVTNPCDELTDSFAIYQVLLKGSDLDRFLNPEFLMCCDGDLLNLLCCVCKSRTCRFFRLIFCVDEGHIGDPDKSENMLQIRRLKIEFFGWRSRLICAATRRQYKYFLTLQQSLRAIWGI